MRWKYKPVRLAAWLAGVLLLVVSFARWLLNAKDFAELPEFFRELANMWIFKAVDGVVFAALLLAVIPIAYIIFGDDGVVYQFRRRSARRSQPRYARPKIEELRSSVKEMQMLGLGHHAEPSEAIKRYQSIAEDFMLDDAFREHINQVWTAAVLLHTRRTEKLPPSADVDQGDTTSLMDQLLHSSRAILNATAPMVLYEEDTVHVTGKTPLS